MDILEQDKSWRLSGHLEISGASEDFRDRNFLIF